MLAAAAISSLPGFHCLKEDSGIWQRSLMPAAFGLLSTHGFLLAAISWLRADICLSRGWKNGQRAVFSVSL